MMEYKGYLAAVEYDDRAGLFHGEEPEKPFSGRFVVRLSPELHRRVWLASRKAGKSLNAWVAERLKQGVSANAGPDS